MVASRSPGRPLPTTRGFAGVVVVAGGGGVVGVGFARDFSSLEHAATKSGAARREVTRDLREK
jgi:hypothetical protein